MGKKGSGQGGMWIATSDLARSPGHPFYERLNRLLDEHGLPRLQAELLSRVVGGAGT